jgi:iron complex outermembrane receptor protein
VDINSIPVNAIERIEILKDGASAIYGSDAIAGVVNFILRKDYTGVDFTASFGAPTRSGGGSETKASAFAGFGDLGKDRYNINLGASIQEIKPIFGRDRAFAKRLNVGELSDGTSNTTFPANIQLNTRLLANPMFPNCGPDSLVSPLQPAGQCRFDNSASISIQPESKQANLLFNGRLNISSSAEAYIDSSFNRNTFDQTEQPVLINGGVLPVGHPYIASQLAFFNAQTPAIRAAITAQGVLGSAFAFLRRPALTIRQHLPIR